MSLLVRAHVFDLFGCFSSLLQEVSCNQFGGTAGQIAGIKLCKQTYKHWERQLLS